MEFIRLNLASLLIITLLISCSVSRKRMVRCRECNKEEISYLIDDIVIEDSTLKNKLDKFKENKNYDLASVEKILAYSQLVEFDEQEADFLKELIKYYAKSINNSKGRLIYLSEYSFFTTDKKNIEKKCFYEKRASEQINNNLLVELISVYNNYLDTI